jgi:hypothetical protein
LPSPSTSRGFAPPGAPRRAIRLEIIRRSGNAYAALVWNTDVLGFRTGAERHLDLATVGSSLDPIRVVSLAQSDCRPRLNWMRTT